MQPGKYTVLASSGVKVFTYFIKFFNFNILAPEHSNTRTLEHSNTQTREHFTHIATLFRKRSIRGLLRGVYPERRRRARNDTLLFAQPQMLYYFFNHWLKSLLKLGLSLRMGCRYKY